MLYTDWRSVPPDIVSSVPVLARKSGKRVGKNRRRYLDIVCAFDIETTRLTDDISFMYIWMVQIGQHATVIGRTWPDFLAFCQHITDDLDDDIYLVMYVHNLSFEFQFLSGVYGFKPDDVFCVDRRAPIRADMFEHIELRCSYRHSNMRLETFLDKLGVENLKLKMDYEKKRYPWTELSQAELDYCINDVKGLVQAIIKEMEIDGDTLYTIPATSTGYVRRDVKAAMRRVRYWELKNMLPDWDTYNMLREAFRGGNTHANRYFARQILKEVNSVDMVSAYPGSQLIDRYPMGPFRIAKNFTWKELEDLRKRRKKALLIRLEMWGLRLKDPFEGCPYISDSKCRYTKRVSLDNGRILSADYLETTLTDVDLEIIEDQYTWDYVNIIYMEHARYGYLPEPLKDLIMEYFKAKTELEKGILRDKIKNKFNAIYGMSAQNPVKDNIIYKGPGRYEYEGKPGELLLEEANKHAFFPYQWGVWCTANVRRRLWHAIREVERQGGEFIYCDTDSVKYTGDVDFSPVNDPIIEACEDGGYKAQDKKGKVHYIAMFESEGTYCEFATRGAKKYAYIKDEKLTAVIAGVPNREDEDHISGGQILAELGGLPAFLADEVVFANKNKISYNDHIRETMEIDGHRLHITPCVTISPTEYTLKDTREYYDLTEISREALYHFRRDILGKI